MRKNGSCWLDTEGNLIQAHGGAILEFQGIHYWYGENKDAVTRDGLVDFIGFSCYSSSNMLDWKNEGVVLRAVTDEVDHELSPSCVGERPKVLFNERTGISELQAIVFSRFILTGIMLKSHGRKLLQGKMKSLETVPVAKRGMKNES